MKFFLTKLVIDYWLDNEESEIYCEVEFGKDVSIDLFHKEVEQSDFESKHKVSIDSGGGLHTEEWTIVDMIFENEDAYEDESLAEVEVSTLIEKMAKEVTEIIKEKGYPASCGILGKKVH